MLWVVVVNYVCSLFMCEETATVDIERCSNVHIMAESENAPQRLNVKNYINSVIFES